LAHSFFCETFDRLNCLTSFTSFTQGSVLMRGSQSAKKWMTPKSSSFSINGKLNEPKRNILKHKSSKEPVFQIGVFQIWQYLIESLIKIRLLGRSPKTS